MDEDFISRVDRKIRDLPFSLLLFEDSMTSPGSLPWPLVRRIDLRAWLMSGRATLRASTKVDGVETTFLQALNATGAALVWAKWIGLFREFLIG